MAESSLQGKKAIITGSGTGIGREIALEFARQGADIVLHYAHSDAGANSAVEEIAAMGRRATALKADFALVEEVASFGQQAIEFLGGVDCLVNNAGITLNMPFLKTTREQYDTLYSVNIRAQFFLTQLIAKYMIESGGGAVCNITSIHGVSGAPEHAVYAGTKGAIIAYTRALAIEIAHKGVRVNAIAPGWIAVENHARIMPGYTPQLADETAYNKVPVGFHGVPLDVAKLAVFLCTEDARFIVGQTIILDGGTTSLMSLIDDFRGESSSRFGLGYVAGVEEPKGPVN
jgi:NAD(P)-dependent dehydrogenase (short-subunit alcohol dehydrogenase family)